MGLLTGMMLPSAESGVLYGPKISDTRGAAVPNPPKPFETDLESIEMLWRTSEVATGVRLLGGNLPAVVDSTAEMIA